jgi:MATE family multidrug resistance protein
VNAAEQKQGRTEAAAEAERASAMTGEAAFLPLPLQPRTSQIELARHSARATMRELVALAWPIAAAMLGDTLLGLVDTKLVGGLGPAAIGGVGVATMLMFLNYSMIFGLMRAVKVRTSFAVGEKRPQDGVRYATAAAALGAIIGVVVFVLGRDTTPILRLLRLDASMIPFARDFFATVTWGAPAVGALQSLVNHRQAIGDVRRPMIVGLGANVFNAFLAYGLIYGHWGLPALGVRGSGYATASTQWVELAALAALVLSEKTERSSLPFRQAVREIVGIGVPGGLQAAGEILAFNAFTAILGSIGAAQMAAHQISLVTIRTSFLPGIAIGEASCILVGRALGRRCLSEADRANRAALTLAVGFMATCGIIFGTFGGAIAHAFTDDGEVASIARNLLIVAALFQVLDAFNVVLRGSLRGAEDVRVPAFLGLAIVWTCVPTAALILGKIAGWGAFGGWCGFLGETTLSTILFGRRWSRGAWRKKYEGEPAPVAGLEAEVAE